MSINTERRGYTAPGTKHTPKVRKGVGGRPVPVEVEPRAFPVTRGPRKGAPSDANLRALALPGADLTPTVVLTPSSEVPEAFPQPRRRDRRPQVIASAAAARQQRRAS